MIFLKTPKFWSEKPNFALKVALKPISEIYSYVSTKNYFKDYKYKSAKSRVVAIGGITVGGSGKTVVVQSICEILKRRKIAVLSRGFGRSSDEILRVDNKIHSYKEAGDEPLALSNSAPVYVGKDRSESAKLAERDGFNFLIL
ncbi:MAG: tetraacyldisaccharide 4'-kinase, partial [Holosporaceae bacterium]|nr:tetraacyldisaccharide 4'-kinase [Holosporaceae bacterium]